MSRGKPGAARETMALESIASSLRDLILIYREMLYDQKVAMGLASPTLPAPPEEETQLLEQTDEEFALMEKVERVAGLALGQDNIPMDDDLMEYAKKWKSEEP